MSASSPETDGRISSMPPLLVVDGSEQIPVVDTAGGNYRVSTALLFGKSSYQLYADAERAAGRTPLSQSAWLTALTGPAGPVGPGAYETYAAAETAAGRTPLSQADWLTSLSGPSAYEVYKSTTSDNPKKTEAQWLDSLKGKSAYQVYLDTTADNPKLTEAQWLNSLHGVDGGKGDTGDTGKSAYQSYLDTTADNPKKTEVQWLASLKGVDGLQGDDGAVGKSAYDVYADAETAAGRTPLSVSLWLDSLKGADGVQGKSAYQSYLDTTGDVPPKTEAQWLVSLKGADGQDGQTGSDGKSAYQSYLDTTSDDPKKSEADWLTSLKGPAGKAGAMGTGLNFVGELGVDEELPDPTSFSNGDTLVKGTHFIKSTGTEWVDLGDFGGPTGKSAYDLYVLTTSDSPVKTQTEWMASLKGDPGTGLIIRGELQQLSDLPVSGQLIGDAYVIAGYQYVWVGVDVSIDGSGWAKVGVPGPTGKSAYQSYLDTTADNPKKSESEWIVSLKGTNGTNGKSAYQSYLDTTSDNPKLSEADWLLTLVGPEGKKGDTGGDGKTAYEVYVSTVPQGETALTEVQWLASLVGPQGAGIVVLAALADTDALNAAAQAPTGHGYLVGTNPGDYYQWNGTAYVNLGPIRGPQGTQGLDAYQVYAAAETAAGRTPLAKDAWLTSLKGEDGNIGPDGKSAYQSYLDTTADDPKLTEVQWLASMKGDVGKSAYQEYVDTTTDSPVKSEVEWLASLKGTNGTNGSDGAPGKSAYEVYVSTVPEGSTPLTPTQWLDSLKGAAVSIQGHVATSSALPTGVAVNVGYMADDTGHLWVSDGAGNWTDTGKIAGTDGKDGTNGADGKSAYQSYLDTTADSPKLSEVEWLTSLKGINGTNGTDGKSAYQSYVDTTSDSPVLSEVNWIASLHGKNGTDGDSAYETYVLHTSDSPVLTEEEWLTSLHGKAAYQSYLDTTADSPKKTESEWIASLHGTDGAAGKSAYEVYVSTVPGGQTPLTLTEWLASLNGKGLIPKGTLADLTALNAVTGMQLNWMYFVGTHMYVYMVNSQGANAWVDQGDMRGPQGTQGLDAYQVYATAAAAAGQTPLDQASWLISLKGDKGDIGATGRSVHMLGPIADITALNAVTGMQQGDSYILQDPAGQMYSYDAVNGWVDQGNLLGPQGIQGPMGPGVEIIGKLTSSEELPTTGTLGQGYLISGDFWGWTGSTYENLGKIQGPTGPQGIQGKVGPIGPQGPDGPQGRRGSQIIILPRDPQITDGSDLSSDVFINITLQTVYQKTSPTNWAYLGTFGGGNVMDAAADGVKRVRLNGAWAALPVDEAPTSDANALYMRKGSAGSWVKFNRYDLAKVVSADGTIDCSLYNAAEIDGTKSLTINLTNLPANRVMTIPLTVVGKGGNLAWPAALKWSNSEAPTLGTSYTNVVLYWDGTRLTGSVGQSV